MRHLHPLAWLMLGISLTVTVVMARNFIVTIVVLACTTIIFKARRSPRAAAFGSALKLGALLGLIVMVIGLFTGTSGGNTTTLFTMPQFNLGAAGSFGGTYTTHRLAATSISAIQILTYSSLVGLMWQACPAGQWCDLAETFLGRGALLLAPLLCIGEALTRTRDIGHPRWGLAATVIDQDIHIVSSWRRYSRHYQASPLSTLVVMFTLIVVTFLVLAAAMFGGIPISLAGDHTLTGLALAGIIACWWAVLRPTIGGAALIPRLTWPDIIAALAGLAPATAVFTAGLTGDAGSLKTPTGQWPHLPPVTLIAVCTATAAVMVLGTTAKHRGAATDDAGPTPPVTQLALTAKRVEPEEEAAHA